jgi:hypothetical protein
MGISRRARSESIGDKDAKATSIAVAGQVALHTGAGGDFRKFIAEDRAIAQRIVKEAAPT